MSVSRITAIAAERVDNAPTKAGVGAAATKSEDAAKPATAIDMLVALVPTEVVAIYTAVTAVVIANLPEATAEDPEPEKYLPLRFGIVAGMVLLTIIWTAVAWNVPGKKAKTDKRKFPVAEGIGATVAAAGWGLTTPGSPLFDIAYSTEFYKAVIPVAVTFAAIAVCAVIALRLQKPFTIPKK